MNPVPMLIRKLGKFGLIILLSICAAIVTLYVFNIYTNPTVEQIADDLIKIETGVDLEQVEETAINKK